MSDELRRVAFHSSLITHHFSSRLRLANPRAHLADGLGESGHDGAGDYVVADVELGDFVDGRDLRDVPVREAVSGGDVQSVLRGERGGLAQTLEFGDGARAALGVDGARAERRVGIDGRAEVYLLRVGVNEEADEEAGFAQAFDRLAHEVEVRRGVQASLGRDLAGVLRDQSHGVGAGVGCYGDHLFGRGHLDVQICRDRAAQRVQVFVLYVPPVAAQVDGDAVRARLLAHHRRRHHARLRRAPRLADCRHVVNVNVESRRHNADVRGTYQRMIWIIPCTQRPNYCTQGK